ncbi:hypothetical protein P691DRAFT_680737 [Macrolepiota fuliginosa MF-IS2]|uniref:Uncharacterized protein n=1 Tax=Macrolepiota fuliginosa MF-IS2 TaxID=1400762 RepID=A0A9P5X2I3_9AGAR|nr:hypothetical protein P691DRAFT_680737 [Macrolepiota fuliginosa MF-IS2]
MVASSQKNAEILTIDVIGRTALGGVLYGIALALYWLSAQALYPRLRGAGQRRGCIVSFTTASIVISIGLVLTMLNLRVPQLDHVDNINLSAPVRYRTRTSLCLLGVAIDALTVGIHLWRVWVIWGATRYQILVTLLPTLFLLPYLGVNTTMILTGVIRDRSDGALMVCYIVTFTLGTTTRVLATLLVVLRLLLMRQRQIRLMVGVSEFGRQYTSISAMLVESCALGSVWALVDLVFFKFLAEGLVNGIFFINESYIEIIAFLLVIYRVSAGRAWNSNTDRQLSTIRWNHDGQLTTGETETGISNHNLSSHGPDLFVESNPLATHVTV